MALYLPLDSVTGYPVDVDLLAKGRPGRRLCRAPASRPAARRRDVQLVDDGVTTEGGKTQANVFRGAKGLAL